MYGFILKKIFEQKIPIVGVVERSNSDIIISCNDPLNPADTVSVTLVVNDAPLIRVEPDTIAMQLGEGEAAGWRLRGSFWTAIQLSQGDLS